MTSEGSSQSSTFYPERSQENQFKRPLGQRQVTLRPFIFTRTWETDEATEAADLSQTSSNEISVFVSSIPKRSGNYREKESPLPLIIQSPTAQVLPDIQHEAIIEEDKDLHASDDGDDDANRNEDLVVQEEDDEDEDLVAQDENDGNEDLVVHEEDDEDEDLVAQNEYEGDEELAVQHQTPNEESLKLPRTRPKLTGSKKISKDKGSTPKTPSNQSMGLSFKTPAGLKSGPVNRVRKKRDNIPDQPISTPTQSKQRKTNMQNLKDKELYVWQGDRRRTSANVLDLDVMLNATEEECFSFKQRCEGQPLRASITGFFLNVRKDMVNKIEQVEEDKMMKSALRKSFYNLQKNRKELLEIQREQAKLTTEFISLKNECKADEHRNKELGEINKWLTDYQLLHRKYRDTNPSEAEKQNFDHSFNTEAILLEIRMNMEASETLRKVNNKMEQWLEEG